MADQSKDSVWRDPAKLDSYVTKFIELLLKYGYEWREKDEEEHQISLPEHKIRLFAWDFHEFQENLTSYHIAVKMKIIREFYKKEVLRLKKAGKSENESKFLWLPKAGRLFSHTIDWENEILNESTSSASSDNTPVKKSDGVLSNFPSESRKSPPVPSMQQLSSSKTPMVAPMPIMPSVSTTTTTSLQHTTNSFLIKNPELHAIRQFWTTTERFPNVNPISTTKSSAGILSSKTTAKYFIIRQPLTLTSNITNIRHPLYVPSSVTPAIRRLLRPNITPSTPLPPKAAYSTVQNLQPVTLISSTSEAAPSSSVASSRIRTSLPYNILSRSEVSLSPINVQQTVQVPWSTTATYSSAKDPRFTNVQSSWVNLLPYKTAVPPSPVTLSSRTSSSSIHTSSRPEDFIWLDSPPPPYRPRVTLSTTVSSSMTTVSHSLTSPSPKGRIHTSDAPSSRSGVLTSAALLSTSGVTTTAAVSSRAIWPYRHPPSYRPRVTLSTTVSSSMTTVSHSLTSPSPKGRIYKSGVLTTDAPLSATGVITTTAVSSRAIWPYRHPPSYRPSVTLSSAVSDESSMAQVPQLRASPSPEGGIFTSIAPRYRAFMSAAPFLTPGVIVPETLSSRFEHLIWPYRHTLPYRQGTQLPSTVSSQTLPTSNADVLSSASPSSVANAFELASASSDDNVYF